MSLPGSHTPYEVQLFEVAGIPVRFSATWLVLAVIAYTWGGTPVAGLTIAVMITLSIVVHELGHGLASRAFGLEPSILIHGFGGWCEHKPAQSRNQDLIIVAAGPGAGLALAGLAWAGLLLYRAADVDSAILPIALPYLVQTNLFLSVLNLLPVLPLDGGRITHNLLARVMPASNAAQATWGASALVAGLVAAAGAWMGEIFVAIFFALFAWRAISQLKT